MSLSKTCRTSADVLNIAQWVSICDHSIAISENTLF